MNGTDSRHCNVKVRCGTLGGKGVQEKMTEVIGGITTETEFRKMLGSECDCCQQKVN